MWNKRINSILIRLALCLFVTYLTLFELLFALPMLFQDKPFTFTAFASSILLAVIFFSISVSLCIFYDSSVLSFRDSPPYNIDHTYCHICEISRPPRTHHCYDCGVCIIRRDHHCSLLASCIGQANWRYFFNTLLFGAIGSGLIAICNLCLVFGDSLYNSPADRSILHRFICLISPPGILWVFGFLTAHETMIYLNTSLCLIIASLLSTFAVYQLKLACSNQTMSERNKQSELNNPICNNPVTLNWKHNLKKIVGENWLAALINPFAKSHFSFDGFYYPS